MNTRDSKVKGKPVYIQLVHTAAYEGPCRVGAKENLTPEADKAAGRHGFEHFVNELKANLAPWAESLEPTYLEWNDDFVLHEAELRKVEPDIYEADLVLLLPAGLTQHCAVTLAQRYGKPIGMLGWVSTVDVAAHLRARGKEGYAFLDYEHLNEFLLTLSQRKALRQTKLLIAIKGDLVPKGVASSIYDLEGLRQRYGVDHTLITAEEVIDTMRALSPEKRQEAEALTDELITKARKVHMERENILPSVNFYFAVKELLAKYESNAFVIPCFEVCATRVMEEERVTFCLAHSLLKDEGIPSACEGDLNALLSLTVLMQVAQRTAAMGNTYVVDRERNILALHHDVPGKQMSGYGTPDLPYELVSFTYGGWGATMRVDLSEAVGQPVTLVRFNPQGTKLLVVQGELTGQASFDTVGCALQYHMKVNDIPDLFDKEQDFGHHLSFVIGDWRKELKALARITGIEVVEA